MPKLAVDNQDATCGPPEKGRVVVRWFNNPRIDGGGVSGSIPGFCGSNHAQVCGVFQEHSSLGPRCPES